MVIALVFIQSKFFLIKKKPPFKCDIKVLAIFSHPLLIPFFCPFITVNTQNNLKLYKIILNTKFQSVNFLPIKNYVQY